MSLPKIIALLSTHSGRDKIAKTLHYAARIALWYYSNTRNKLKLESVEKFRQTVGESRRIGRLFGSLSSIPDILSTAKNLRSCSGSDLAMNSALLLAHCCDFLYFISDNLTFAASHQFINLPGPTVEWLDNVVGCYTWLISVLVWIVWVIRQYLMLLGKKRKIEVKGKSQEESRKLDAEMKSTVLLGIALICDLQLALFFLYGFWNSQLAGVFGVLGGLTGIYSSLL